MTPHDWLQQETFAAHSVRLELLWWPTAEKVSGPLPLEVIENDQAFEFSQDGRFVALVAPVTEA